MVAVKAEPLEGIIASIQKLNTELLAIYCVSKSSESTTLQSEATILEGALDELQRALPSQRRKIQYGVVDSIESPTRRCLLEAKQVLANSKLALTKDTILHEVEDLPNSEMVQKEEDYIEKATTAVKMCYMCISQSLILLEEANQQGPADDTYSATETQNSDALSSYEEGILTPKTAEIDESRASSVTPIILETGLELSASLNPEVPNNILADWHPHMDCLSKLEDWKSQEDVLTNYQNGTGIWILDDSGFKEWLEGNVHMHICCLYGPVGAGKTTLAAFIIDHLKNAYNAENVGIAAIFIDPRHPRYPRHPECSPLFGHLAHQLLQQAPANEALKGYLESQGLPTGHEFDIFKKTVEQYSKVFVVIDGLNEWPGKQVADFFKQWQSLPDTGKFRLLVTSRKPTLHGLDGERTALVEILPNKEDIRKFAEARIHACTELLEYVGTELARVVEEIVEKSQGIFLLAQLHLKFLASQMGLITMEEALPLLAHDLNTMVENILDTMVASNSEPEGDSELVRVVLLCVTYSPVALKCEEIMKMISTFLDREVGTGFAAVPVALNTALRSGLIVIESKRGGFVGLANKIVREVIEADPRGRFSRAHSSLSIGCCNYFEQALESFKTTDAYGIDIVRRKSEDPLLAYATANWGRHARESENEGPSHKRILSFITQDDLIDSVMHVLHRDQVGFSPKRLECSVCEEDKDHEGANPQPGHRQAVIAAHFGLVRVLEGLTTEHGLSKENIAAGIRNGAGQSLLSIAAGNGHECLAQWILSQCQVDYNHQCDLLKRTPLARAAAGCHASVITLLLTQHGLNPNLTDLSRRTALHHAVDFADEEIVELLLSRGDVNPNLRDGLGAGETPLMIAIHGQKMEMVRLLLARKDVDVNINAGWRTPLIEAVCLRNLEMVGRLLGRRDIDVNIGTTAGTPIRVARNGGDHRVVELLERRSNINKD
ncbi:hypothetical protein EV426DRAFT_603088 [Tirmania nivea]|nr:hypothetical protein EV426DRAFT_603088 [Tirmania nivea]